MRTGRILIWVLVLIAGFGMMLSWHLHTRRLQRGSRWGGGLICVAADQLPEDATRLGGRRALVRFLPPRRESSLLAEALSGARAGLKQTILWNSEDKVVLLPDFAEAFCGVRGGARPDGSTVPAGTDPPTRGLHPQR